MDDNRIFYRQVANAIAAYLMQELEIRPNVHWKVRDATSGPRVLTLNLLLNPKYAKQIIPMAEALSMAAGLDKSVSIRIGRGNRGSLCVEIPKPRSLWYNISVSSLPRRRGLLASIGLDNDKRPATVNFADPLSPHCLVAGATGSGKSNALRLLVHNLAWQNNTDQVGFILIDCQKRGKWWRDFANIPHLLHPIVTDTREAIKVLAWAVAEIDRRSLSGRVKPRVFICLDEAQAVLSNEDIGGALGTLTAVGREFGVHCVLGLQNPTAEMMGGTANLKRNVVARLVGKVDGGTAAYAATGRKETGAEALVGAGDFLLVQPGDITRLTAALLTDRDIANLPRNGNGQQHLDLGQYEDVEHVIEQADMARRKPDRLESHQLAVALVHGQRYGINKFARLLRIGNTKAQRVLEFADDLRRDLGLLGHGVYPKSSQIKSAIPIPVRYAPK